MQSNHSVLYVLTIITAVYAVFGDPISGARADCGPYYDRKMEQIADRDTALGIATAPAVIAGGILTPVIPPVGIPILATGLATGTTALADSLVVAQNIRELQKLLESADAAERWVEVGCDYYDCSVSFEKFDEARAKTVDYDRRWYFSQRIEIPVSFYREFLPRHPEVDRIAGAHTIGGYFEFLKTVREGDVAEIYCPIKKSGRHRTWSKARVERWIADRMVESL